MDTFAVGAKPGSWEGSGVGRPNQLRSTVLKKKTQKKSQIFEGFLFHYFYKSSEKRFVWTHPELLVGPAPRFCSWRQLPVPFVQQFFFPLRSLLDRKRWLLGSRKFPVEKHPNETFQRWETFSPTRSGFAWFSPRKNPRVANPRLIPVPLLHLGSKAPSHCLSLLPSTDTECVQSLIRFLGIPARWFLMEVEVTP